MKRLILLTIAFLLSGHLTLMFAQGTPSATSSFCSTGNPASISGSTGAQGVLDPANTIPADQPEGGLIWPAGAVTAFISMGTGQVLFFNSSGLDAGSAFLPGVSGPQPFPDGKLNFISVRLPTGTTVNFASGAFGEGFDTAGFPPPVTLLSCQDLILEQGSTLAGSTRRAIGQGSASGQESMPGAFPGAVGAIANITPAGFGPRSGSVPSAGFLYPPAGGSGGNASGNSSFANGNVGGGPGGAALVLSAAQRLTINGSINAFGFDARSFGSGVAQGGGGGSVRLAALLVEGNGTIDTSAGLDSDNVKRSPDGPIEIQAFVQDAFAGTTTTSAIRGNPVAAPLPGNLPTIQIVEVSTGAGDFCGFECSNTGSLVNPDITLPEASAPVDVTVRASVAAPVGTILVFRAVGNDGSAVEATAVVPAGCGIDCFVPPPAVVLTLQPGATYQIVVTPSTPFALARGNPALVAERRAPSPAGWEGYRSGAEGTETQPRDLAARWARALGADPGALAQVARVTVRVGSE